MTHLWIRAEQRENEQRCGVTPDGVRALIAKGLSTLAALATLPVLLHNITFFKCSCALSW